MVDMFVVADDTSATICELLFCSVSWLFISPTELCLRVLLNQNPARYDPPDPVMQQIDC